MKRSNSAGEWDSRRVPQHSTRQDWGHSFSCTVVDIIILVDFGPYKGDIFHPLHEEKPPAAWRVSHPLRGRYLYVATVNEKVVEARLAMPVRGGREKKSFAGVWHNRGCRGRASCRSLHTRRVSFAGEHAKPLVPCLPVVGV